MSIVLPTIDLSSIGSSFQVTPPSNLQANQIGWITLLNESPYTLTFQAGGMALPIPAWDDYPIRISQQQVNGVTNVLGGFSLPITIMSQLLVNPSTSQSTKLVITFFSPGELPPNTVPRSLVRQTWIPNTLNTTGNEVANILQNDGSAPGTQFLESTPSDAASSTWSFKNDGTGFVKADNAGVLSLLLQFFLTGVEVGQVLSIGTGVNASNALTIDPGADAHRGIVVFNHSATQTGDLFRAQDNTFANMVTIGANGLLSALKSLLVQNILTITPQAQQILANNGTISFTGSVIHVSSAAAVTGIIMAVGNTDGQTCILLNDGGFTITFAAAGSNVGSGSNNVLNPGRNIIMLWNATAAQWQNHGGN